MMRLEKILAVASAGLLLAGCTAGSNPDGKNSDAAAYKFKISESKKGLPSQLQNDPFNASPSIYWTNKVKDSVTLIAYGSGSCPVVPADLVLNSSSSFRLPLKSYPGACTADLGAHVSVFNVPAKVSRTKPVTVTLDSKTAGLDDTQLTLAPASILSELGD